MFLTNSFLKIFFLPSQVAQHVIDYTHCNQIIDGILLTNTTCADVLLKYPNNPVPCTCSIDFSLDRNFSDPVFMYYRLTNFYQNKRNFIDAVNDYELVGDFSTKPNDYDDYCKELNFNNGKRIIPCGGIANSIFNDTISLFSILHGDVPVYNTGIAWTNKRRFRNPPNLKEALKDKATPIAWRKNLWELDPHNPENNGLQNEEFIVWMRTAAMSSFNKLYRRVNHDSPQVAFKNGLPIGRYVLRIVYSMLIQHCLG